MIESTNERPTRPTHGDQITHPNGKKVLDFRPTERQVGRLTAIARGDNQGCKAGGSVNRPYLKLLASDILCTRLALSSRRR